MPKPAITTFSSLAVNQSPTNKDNGLYAPELTQEQIDAIPADTLRNGAIVYNITKSSFEIYEDGDWENINTTGGDVKGPDLSVANNIATFSDNTGKIIRDSGVPIDNVPVLLLSQRTNKKFLKAPLVTVNEIGNLGHIRFVNDIGIIFVDGLMPVEFITNDFGPESQVCSLFTGGLPSVSSSPSALVELQTTTGTLLLSRLTQAEINALTLPIPGMVVYNTTTGKLSVYTATGWMPVFVADTSGNLDMQGYKIINLATPTLSTDSANKGYVDAAISGIPSATITLTGGVTGSGVVTSPITTTVVSVAPSAITGYPGTTSTFLRGDGTWTNILSGNLGLQNTTPNAPLQFSNTLANRKIVLNEVLNNDHQITALGTNSNIFRFQVPATTNDYVFYAGTSSTTSNEVARLTGTGNAIIPNNIGIGTTPTSPLHVKIPLGVSDIGTEYAKFQGSGVRLNIFDQDLTGSPALGARILFNSGAIGVIQSASSLAIIPGGGYNVGINTYTPSTTFQVVGTSTLGNITVSGNTISASSGSNIQIGQPVFMSDNGLWLRTGSDTNHGMIYNATINGPQFRSFGSFSWNNGTSGATELMRLTSTGYLGIGTSTPNALLQFSNANGNRKIVLFDDQNNDFQFIGFGVSSNTLRYNVSGPNTNHVFFAGVDATSANELMRIRGNGNVGIGTSAPNAPLQFNNTLTNRKIVLNEVLNNDHQVLALGTATNIFRFQIAATTNDYVFYAGTSSTTSNELARIKGTGGIDVVNNKIINLATPTLGTDGANKSYVDSVTSNVANAKYIIQTSNPSLPNAQVLGSLTTGLLKNTTTTGVLSIGVAGTDYYAPGFPTFFKDTNGTTNNFFAGTNAGNSITTGQQNIGIGSQALYTNITGSLNVAIGYQALYNNTTGFNIAIGSQALYTNTAGAGNVGIGYQTLQLNTIGNENVAIGSGNLSRTTSGNNNIAIGGAGVLSDNTTGSKNVAVGAASLNAVTTGVSNIAIGPNAGLTCTTSTNCIFLGEFADASVNNLTNAIAIGANTIVGASNSIILGNGCNIGIGVSSPTSSKLQIDSGSNSSAISVTSSVASEVSISLNSTNGSGRSYSFRSINDGTLRIFDGTAGLARFIIASNGNAGIGAGFIPAAPLQFNSLTPTLRTIDFLITGQTSNNNYQFYGFGTGTNSLNYNVFATTANHIFYAGASSTTSNELMRITGTGNLGIGTNAPNAPLQFSNTFANRKIVLFEGTNNDHQFTGIGSNANILRFQVGNTTTDYVFYAGTSSTTSSELARITGVGDFVAAGYIYGNRPTGMMYITDTLTPFSSSSGAIQKIPTTTVSAQLNLFSMPVNNRLLYTGTRAILNASVILCITVLSDANGDVSYAIYVYKNGVLIPGSKQVALSRRDVGAGSPAVSITSSSLTSLNSNDYLEAYISVSNGNVFVNQMSLTVTAV